MEACGCCNGDCSGVVVLVQLRFALAAAMEVFWSRCVAGV